MAKTCLCLTGKTIAQNLNALEHYRNRIDMCELRVDFLEAQEQFLIRSFPEKAGMPVILTVRRRTDGGRFDSGEGVRLVILAKGLAYADVERRKNFAYVDIEHDLHIQAIEEAARTFGTRIIRSIHCLNGLPANLPAVWDDLSSRQGEIPKLSVQTKGIGDAETLFRFFSARPHEEERIITGMGDYGFCTRILSDWMGSAIRYHSAAKAGLEPAAPGQLDPFTMAEVYRGSEPKPGWYLYGLLGGPAVIGSLSPGLHNAGFSRIGLPSLYLPFPADDLDAFLRLAELLPLKGFSVTVPMKERILARLAERSPEVDEIGACNTAVRTAIGWSGYNTDAVGFRKSVLEFMGTSSLRGVKACIIGAGGAARAVAYALHELGAKACVINRNMSKAKRLAEHYAMPWAGMAEKAVDLLERHNELIVQTTSVGMEGGPPGDPIDWYEFTGSEALFETIYNPAETPLLKRAREAGCKATNGLGMLHAQAAAQFRLFTGMEYPAASSQS